MSANCASPGDGKNHISDYVRLIDDDTGLVVIINSVELRQLTNGKQYTDFHFTQKGSVPDTLGNGAYRCTLPSKPSGTTTWYWNIDDQNGKSLPTLKNTLSYPPQSGPSAGGQVTQIVNTGTVAGTVEE